MHLRRLSAFDSVSRFAERSDLSSRQKHNISDKVDRLVQSGILKLNRDITADNIQQFAFDVALAIQDYKIVTGRSNL